jgi:hypothetical protein
MHRIDGRGLAMVGPQRPDQIARFFRSAWRLFALKLAEKRIETLGQTRRRRALAQGQHAPQRIRDIRRTGARGDRRPDRGPARRRLLAFLFHGT